MTTFHVHAAAGCAQARYEAAYVHVMSVLKHLLDPGASSGNGSLPVESRLSAAERQAFLQTLLQARAEASFPPPVNTTAVEPSLGPLRGPPRPLHACRDS